MAHKTLKDGTLMTKPDCMYHQKTYHAVMKYREVEADATEAECAALRQAYNNTPKTLTGYITYTDAKQRCRLSYPRIFAAVKTLHRADPYSVSFSVNRMGENTVFKLK